MNDSLPPVYVSFERRPNPSVRKLSLVCAGMWESKLAISGCQQTGHADSPASSAPASAIEQVERQSGPLIGKAGTGTRPSLYPNCLFLAGSRHGYRALSEIRGTAVNQLLFLVCNRWCLRIGERRQAYCKTKMQNSKMQIGNVQRLPGQQGNRMTACFAVADN